MKAWDLDNASFATKQMISKNKNKNSVATQHVKKMRAISFPCGALKNECDFLKLASAFFLNIRYQKAVILKLTPLSSPRPLYNTSSDCC